MKYEGVSAELLDRIARDVRAYDKSRTTEVRSQEALERTQETLHDWFDTWQNANHRIEDRQVETLRLDEIRTAIQVLKLSLLVPRPSSERDVRTFLDSPTVRSLLAQFGIEGS